MYLAGNENSYKQVTAIVLDRLNSVSNYLKARKSSGNQKIYDKHMVKNIDAFLKNPKTFKRINAPKIPDGSPIGME